MTDHESRLRAALEAIEPEREGEWTTQGEYNGERFTDEVSDSTYTDVVPVNGSWPEDVVCHVWGTERDDAKTAAYIAAANPEAIRSLLDELDALRATTSRGDSAKRLSDAPAGLGVERCGAHLAGWVSVEDRMPEAGTTCLVWSLRSWEKAHSAKIDTWDEQREAPVPFSSHTIPIGLGWDEHDDFYSVTHWMPLPSAPLPDATVTQGHSHGSEQDGPNSGSGSEKNA